MSEPPYHPQRYLAGWTDQLVMGLWHEAKLILEGAELNELPMVVHRTCAASVDGHGVMCVFHRAFYYCHFDRLLRDLNPCEYKARDGCRSIDTYGLRYDGGWIFIHDEGHWLALPRAAFSTIMTAKLPTQAVEFTDALAGLPVTSFCVLL